MPNLSHIFSIVAAITLSHGQSLPNRYSNLYNGDTNGLLKNMFELGTGALNFLKESRLYSDRELPDTTPQFGDVFDFVVIGAGTAGATIAARLSEICQVKVLLIEAGSHEKFFMDIPLGALFLQTSNDINWKYRSKPSNKYCLGMNNKSCNIPRGRVMGGSSVLNFMIATRGGAKDYDRWAEMGNEGWAYKDVFKYFKKLETMDIPELQSDKTYHGTEGPVHITHPVYHTPLAKVFLEAAKELGYPLVDYNGKDMIGFSYLQTTIANGTRMSSNRAYLHPVRGRNNLHVTLDSTVRKMLFDRRTNRTIGVEFIKHNRIIRVFASKEVILCAGAVGSPQLLMLSGVGPAKHLTDLGIDVVRNAPVGENLMDHACFAGLTWVTNAIGLQLFNSLNLSHVTDFLTKRSGPVTVPGACEAIGFVDTKHPEKRDSLPDIELLLVSNLFKGDILNPILAGIDIRIYQKWDKYIGKNGWCIAPILLKPKSRGRIILLANDVNVKPEIVLNYFDDPEDVKTMIAGIKTAISVGRTKAMQAFDSQLLNDVLLGCENYEYDSYALLLGVYDKNDVFLAFSYGRYMCKMGPRGDPTAVVDPKLKLFSALEYLRIHRVP